MSKGINYLGQAIPDGGLPQQPSPQQNPMLAFMQMFQQMIQPQQQAPQQQAPQQNGLAELISAVQPKKFGIGGAEVTPANPTGDPRDPFNSGFFKTPEQRAAIESSRQVGMPSVESLASNPYYLSQGQGAAGAVAASPPTYASPQDTDFWARKDLWEQTRKPAGKPKLPRIG